MTIAHPLDRPVWSMLTGRQAHLAEGDARALRLDRGYGVFGIAADTGAEAQAALAALIPPGEDLWIVDERWPLPPGTRELKRAVLTQMVAEGPPPARDGEPAIIALGEADAAEMAALAEHAKPGPWGPKTHRYGPFFGIRDDDGRLLAMAGQRILLPGMAEVSGVSTWADCRGRGYARALIGHVMRDMVVRGEQPFLHSYADNAGAIALYESLGFRIRREVHVLVIGK